MGVLPKNMEDNAFGEIYMLVDENNQTEKIIVKNPQDSNWVKTFDENSGRHFYYNKITQESRWELPKKSCKYVNKATRKYCANPKVSCDKSDWCEEEVAKNEEKDNNLRNFSDG